MTTKTPKATRPANYTKAAWEKATYTVYLRLIELVKGGTISAFTTNADVRALFEGTGIAKTTEERQIQTVNLLITMAKDRTSKGEKERHVLPCSTLRAFFNGEYAKKAALPVTYALPKAPKTTTKTKKATKAPTIKDALDAAGLDEATKSAVLALVEATKKEG